MSDILLDKSLLPSGQIKWDAPEPPAGPSPQGPLGHGFQFVEPDPSGAIQSLSETVGPGTAQFNGLSTPPSDIDINAFMENPQIQQLVRESPNPEETMRKVQNALGIAKMTGVPPAEVLSKLGLYQQEMFNTQDNRTGWEQIQKSLQIGVEQAERSILGIRALMGDEEAKEEGLKYEISEIGEYNNFLTRVFGKAAQQGPRMAGAAGTGLVAGGAAAAAAAPFGAAGPAFLWTFPKVTMTSNMMMEAGSMYLDILQMQGESGEQISEGNARINSLAYGAFAGFLETVGQKMMVLPGGMKLAQGLTNTAATGFRSFLTRTATRFATASLGEGVTEFTQEVAGGYARNIAAAVENMKMNRPYRVQDFIEDQVARGELDRDKATEMLNSPWLLTDYIEELGGEEALGIGEHIEGGFIPLATQKEIYADAATAFVTAMMVGGVYGSVPSIYGAARETKARTALKGEVSGIVIEYLQQNPDADLETVINDVMQNESIANLSERFVRSAAELAEQRFNDPERIASEQFALKREREQFRRESAEDAVSKRFEDQYLEETRPEIAEYKRRLEETRQEGQDQTLVPPEDQMVQDFITEMIEQEGHIVEGQMPDFSNQEQVASFVRNPDMQESLKTYWLERHASEEGISVQGYRELYRQRTAAMGSTVDALETASRYVASTEQQQGLLEIANTLQQELNRVQTDMSLPNMTMQVQQQFSEDIRNLQNETDRLRAEVEKNPNSFESKDSLAIAQAELKVAELRAKDSSEIAARVMDNINNGYAFIDAQARALSEIGVEAGEMSEALGIMQSATAQELYEITRTPNQRKSDIARKIDTWMNRNASSILKTKTRNMHSPYAKAIKLIQSQVTKRRGTGNTDTAIRDALTKEIAETGQLSDLYERGQINEVLKKPVNKWTPIEMLQMKNLVDVMAEVGRREVKRAQERMNIRAEANRQRIAENLGRFDEYIEEKNQQLVAKTPNKAINFGPKRVNINVTQEQVDTINKYTSLDLDMEELTKMRTDYNEKAQLFNWSLGALKEADFDYEGFAVLYRRDRQLKLEAEFATSPKKVAEYNEVHERMLDQSRQIEKLTTRWWGTDKFGLTGEDMVKIGGTGNPSADAAVNNQMPESELGKMRDTFNQINARLEESKNKVRELADAVYNPDKKARQKKSLWGEVIFPHVLVDNLNGKRAYYRGLIHETFITNPIEAEAQTSGDIEFRKREVTKVMQEQDVTWDDLKNEIHVRNTTVTVEDAMYWHLANKSDAFTQLVKAEQRIDDATWNEVIEGLDPSYKAVAEVMHKHLKESYDEIRDVAQMVYGKDMGYISEWLPLFRDMASEQGIQHMDILETFEAPKKLEDSFTLRRSQRVSGSGIRTDLASLYWSMMPKQRRFVRMAEPVMIMEKTIGRGDEVSPLAKQMQQTLGNGYLEALNKLMDRYKNPNVTAKDTAFEHLMRRWTRNSVSTKLFLNMGTATKQVLSGLNYVREVGLNEYISAGIHVSANFNQVKQAVYDMDPYIANRVFQIGTEEINKLRLNHGETFVKAVQDVGISPIRFNDKMTVLTGWWASYQQGIKKFGNRDKAIQHARELTIRSQPDANPTTLPAIYSQNAFSRWFLAFSQQPYKNLSLMLNDMPRSVRRVWEENAGNGRAKQAAATAAEAVKWGTTLEMQAILFTAMTGMIGAIRGYNDDPGEDFLLDVLVNKIAWVPIVGSALSAAYHGFSPSTLPFHDMGSTAVRILKDMGDGNLTMGTIRGVAGVLSTLTGLPANRIVSVFNYLAGE